jgi:dTDP-glucose 4,6-dehydratase
MILVTGGAGFIGSNFVLEWLSGGGGPVINLDRLTYAGNLDNLRAIEGNEQYRFVHGDIGDSQLVAALLAEHRPGAIVNFAAESHVDRSIHGPDDFIQANVVATHRLLAQARAHHDTLAGGERDAFRFLHVSTDEVYGSLAPDAPAFSEAHQYAPNSPYSASKAASDHLVRAYHHTYGLPTLTTNCSNNYGPFQFPEKLIPLIIHNARAGNPLPVYGDGLNVRDWLFVGDHCDALRTVLARGRVGEVYNIGGNSEKTNLDVVHTVCGVLDELSPGSPVTPHAELVQFVKDRPGHDRRYAIDPRKIDTELGWKPRVDFEQGIRLTVQWYLEHDEWTHKVVSGEYRDWVNTNYGTEAR